MGRPLEDYHFSENASKLMTDPKSLLHQLSEGKNFSEILGFDQEILSHFYRVAYELFQKKQYADALDAFLFLTSIEPSNFDFWIGLGMTIQVQGRIQLAIDAYEIAALIDLENPIPYFFLSKCFFAIHDRASSFEAIELALEYSNGKLEYSQLNQHAEEVKQMMLRDMAE